MFDEGKRLEIIQAIEQVREGILWKPGKGMAHLLKRINLGHLDPSTTIEEYNIIISSIVRDADAKVYVYTYGKTFYPTVTSSIDNTIWLVMMGVDGVLETAFPPKEPESYLANSMFIYVGLVKDLL
jgi:hypothetical protein